VIVMAAVDAPGALKRWFADWNHLWRARSIKADLMLPDRVEDLNKAGATFETPTHVASVTAWGTGAVEIGTVELIVMDLSSQAEVTSQNREYETTDDLRRALDECANTLMTLMSGAERST
jgi:hypothetical protein